MKILIISNMYPSIEAPSSGIFVKRISDQLSSCPDIIVDTWTLPHWNKYLAYLYFYFAFIFKILVSRPNYTYWPSRSVCKENYWKYISIKLSRFRCDWVIRKKPFSL